MINGGPYRGELYEVGDTEFDSLMNIEDYDYNRMITTEDTEVEQSGSTEPLNTDSDDDGVTDGEEVLGWKITVSIRKADNTGIKLIVIDEIESDPLRAITRETTCQTGLNMKTELCPIKMTRMMTV